MQQGAHADADRGLRKTREGMLFLAEDGSDAAGCCALEYCRKPLLLSSVSVQAAVISRKNTYSAGSCTLSCCPCEFVFRGQATL